MEIIPCHRAPTPLACDVISTRMRHRAAAAAATSTGAPLPSLNTDSAVASPPATKIVSHTRQKSLSARRVLSAAIRAAGGNATTVPITASPVSPPPVLRLSAQQRRIPPSTLQARRSFQLIPPLCCCPRPRARKWHHRPSNLNDGASRQ